MFCISYFVLPYGLTWKGLRSKSGEIDKAVYLGKLLELTVVSSSTQLTEITGRLIQSSLKSEILQGTFANLIYDGQCANCAGAVPPRQNSWHWSLWKSQKLDSASSYSVIDGVYFVDSGNL